MFKDKVKVTVVALVMVLLMVLSITTDLFVGLADIFRAKAEEATPTDATPVTRDVTVYKELNDSDKDRNLAGAVIKVFKDSACAESITEFVLSYDGKSYGGENEVEFTAKGGDETVNVPFKSLDLTKYAGKSLYVICELKYDGEVIATHNEDGTDPDEVFYVPAVETNAIDATTNTQYSILDKTQIIDSVKYSNLPR